MKLRLYIFFYKNFFWLTFVVIQILEYSKVIKDSFRKSISSFHYYILALTMVIYINNPNSKNSFVYCGFFIVFKFIVYLYRALNAVI